VLLVSRENAVNRVELVLKVDEVFVDVPDLVVLWANRVSVEKRETPVKKDHLVFPVSVDYLESLVLPATRVLKVPKEVLERTASLVILANVESPVSKENRVTKVLLVSSDLKVL